MLRWQNKQTKNLEKNLVACAEERKMFQKFFTDHNRICPKTLTNLGLGSVRTHHSLVIVNSTDHISFPHLLHHRTIWIQDQRLKLQNRPHLSTYAPIAAKKPILRLWLSAVSCQKTQFYLPLTFSKTFLLEQVFAEPKVHCSGKLLHLKNSSAKGEGKDEC